jgi:acetyltransferase-like isoleucine patch superfamily enzyme
MKVELTERSLAWLADRRILFHGKGWRRLGVGDRLDFLENTEVEPYIGVYAGDTICPMGFMSFSNSPLSKKLAIGRYCSISFGVQTHLAGHPLDHVSTSPVSHNVNAGLVQLFLGDNEGPQPTFVPTPSKPEPIIEHDVWIGVGVTLLPGVVISTGAVIGAGSVVTRNVGPYEIVGGNPARLIRKRFSEEIIAGLLETQWWRYKFSNFKGLDFDNPAKFLPGFIRRQADLEPFEPPRTRLAEIPI